MKRNFLLVLLVLSFGCTATQLLSAQSTQYDEEVVRNAYAKFSFLCALDTVSSVAEKQDLGKGSTDPHYLNNRLDKTVPTFSLTNFTSGPLSDIANKSWGDFVSPQSSATLVMDSGTSNRYYSDNGQQVTWVGAHVSWSSSDKPDASTEAAMMARPVSKVIEMAGSYWSSVPVTYTNYVAYTVDASLDGKSTGPHKALYLFGIDAKGKEFVAQQDLISGGTAGMWQLLVTPTYPAGFLQSPLRNTSAVSTWIRSNEMPASSCDATKRDVCCLHGHCGISQTDLNRDLAAPMFKNGGQQ